MICCDLEGRVFFHATEGGVPGWGRRGRPLVHPDAVAVS